MVKHPDLKFDRVRMTLRTKSGAIPHGFAVATLQGGAVWNRLEAPAYPGNWEIEMPVTSPYVSVSGDSATFNSGAFIKDNFPNLKSDEGLTIYNAFVMSATCATPAIPWNGGLKNGRWYPYNTWTLDPKVYGKSSISLNTRYIDGANDVNVYAYNGGPQLAVQTAAQNLKLNGEVACLELDVLNTSDFDATLSYLSFKSKTGAVLIESIKDISNPSSPITYTVNAGGIAQIGSMPAQNNGSVTTRRFQLCLRSNNCNKDSLDISVGWDCKAYPASTDESNCNKIRRIYLTPADSELGMIIKKPSAAVTNDLCAEQEYVVELSSSKLGNLSNINLEFELPSGQKLIPNSFQYAWPLTSNDPDLATFSASADPTNTYGNTWKINVSEQNTTLNTTGLPGTLQIGQNVMFVKFRTTTQCNFLSGSSLKFLSWAYNSCGDITNYRNSPAGTLQINSTPDVFKSDVNISSGSINPCKNEGFAVNIGFSILSNSIATASTDSIMIVLPLGVNYVPNSLVAGVNAISGNPMIQNNSGQQTLIWDIKDGLVSGENAAFTFNVSSVDAQQACLTYKIQAFTFSSKQILCTNPLPATQCSVREVSDESSANVLFSKPDLNILAFSASSQGVPTNQEKTTFSITLKNIGASVPSGATTNVNVYADNGDGELSTGDILLFTATTTNAIPANSNITITGMANVPSGKTCRLLAIIDPATTCVCSIRRSFVIEPEIDMPFARSVSVCSNTTINVGPQPLQDVAFNWSSYQGGNLGALTPTNNSPTVFKFKNISGVNQVNKYLLRMTRGNTCVSYDTLQVTVFPEIKDSATVSACKAATFSLAGTTGGTNYAWTPTNNLSSSTIPNPTVTGLTVNTKYVLTFTDANACLGTYKTDIKLADCANTALGDTIWWDKNYNGLQEVGEPGVEGITVVLVDPSSPTVAISSATTNATGYFIFDKIPAGDYQIKFILPATMTFTKANQGTNDAKDSDADIVTGLTHSKYVSNGNRDFTFDAGIIYVDYGDLPDGATGTSTANYNTNLNDNGANHVIIDGLTIGNIVDGEQNGQPSTLASGDDNSGAGDDEDGIGITNSSNFWTLNKMVNLPIQVNNTTGQTAYLKAYVDWNNDGDFLDVGELIVDLSGITFPNSVNVSVPNNAVVNQLLGVRFRLSLDASMTSVGRVASGEVEDYVVTIFLPKHHLSKCRANNLCWRSRFKYYCRNQYQYSQ